MKKFVLATVLALSVASIAFASPLADYSQGKADLEINYRSPSYDANLGVEGTSLQTGNVEFDGDNNLEWGFTYGIGNNWALQYRQATPQGKLNLNYSESTTEEPTEEPTEYSTIAYQETTASNTLNIGLTAKTRIEEYNALYKLDKNFSLFTGVVRANPSVKIDAGAQYNGNNYSGNVSIQGHDKNIWQFGLVANAPLADRLTVYSIASFGSDYRNWEVGLGYQISKELELNVNYRDLKIDNMTVAGVSLPDGSYDVTTDTKIKGWGFGVDYKF